VIVEAERNLAEKLPQVLPVFRLIVSRVSSSCAFAICWRTWLWKRKHERSPSAQTLRVFRNPKGLPWNH
jgi:hypothetical protein